MKDNAPMKIKDYRAEIEKLKSQMREQEITLMARIAAKIQRRRQEKNMTQEDLADFIGVGRTQMTNLEAGRSNFTIAVFRAVCEALELSADDLLEL